MDVLIKVQATCFEIADSQAPQCRNLSHLGHCEGTYSSTDRVRATIEFVFLDSAAIFLAGTRSANPNSAIFRFIWLPVVTKAYLLTI